MMRKFFSHVSRKASPIVPPDSLSGRALVMVVALMTFLAALTAGLVVMVNQTAEEWRSEIRKELTVRIKPVQGRDVDAEVFRVVAALKSLSGVAEVQPISREDTQALLAPWFGAKVDLDALPVPRLISLRLDPDRPADKSLIERTISLSSGAVMDDHSGWSQRLVQMSDATIGFGVFLFLVVLSATALTVVFATRAAMAGNRGVVEVLHYVGARNQFIAREFERHFFRLGLVGAMAGAFAALVALGLVHTFALTTRGTPTGDQLMALLGSFQFGWIGTFALLFVALIVSAVTAITSRLIVHRTLAGVE